MAGYTGQILLPSSMYVSQDASVGDTAQILLPSSLWVVADAGIMWSGATVSPGEGTSMPKGQFQSTESMLVAFPPFVDKTTGSYILGTDTCTLTIKKPDNSVSTVSMTYDSDVNMWTYTISSGSYQQGKWMFKAVSNNAGALNQYKIEHWGDYVDDITVAKTQATTAATQSTAAASSAASADSKATAIQAKTDNLPSSPAAVGSAMTLADGAITSAKLASGVIDGNATGIKAKTDLITSDPATQTSLLAVKAKTDNLPSVPASQADVAAATSEATNAKNAALSSSSDVTFLKKIAANRWRVHGTQLVTYQDDGVTVLKAFDLFDETGAPSGTRIFERVPV